MNLYQCIEEYIYFQRKEKLKNQLSEFNYKISDLQKDFTNGLDFIENVHNKFKTEKEADLISKLFNENLNDNYDEAYFPNIARYLKTVIGNIEEPSINPQFVIYKIRNRIVHGMRFVEDSDSFRYVVFWIESYFLSKNIIDRSK